MGKKTGFVVAIDGPAGAGKSTVAKSTAARLGFEYLDTGAMYRTLAWLALKKDVSVENSERLKELISYFDNIDISTNSKGSNRIFLQGQDISEEIRRPEISQAVSYVANDVDVRYYMVKKQREIAQGKNCVLEGRDIATKVFPDADIKIYLTASINERVRRRWKELLEKGFELEYDEIEYELKDRDAKDKNRKVGALIKSCDAITVDTTGYTLEEVISIIEKEIISKYKEKIQF